MSSAIIQTHSNQQTGVASTWFNNLTAAQQHLDSIPLPMRGTHTGLEPLKVATFFDIWRVDQIGAI